MPDVLAVAMVATVLIIVPPVLPGSPFLLSIGSQIFLTVLTLLGFYLIIGLSKQFSLAQVAIYGIGAYTMALLTTSCGLTFGPAILLTAAFGAVVGGIIAIPGARFTGPWLALVTFAFAEIARILMARWKGITGGNAGFPNIPRPEIAGFQISSELHYYYLFLMIAAISVLVVARLRTVSFGRIWIALGDDPSIAASTGVNVFRQRVLAFAVGSFFSALAGGAFASYSTFISPESFGFGHTIYHLTILVVGGLESLGGGIVSAVLFVLLHNQLKSFHPWDVIVDGIVIIFFMNVLPRGLGSLWDNILLHIRHHLGRKS
jgi:branched-chain amino acid transport system permease protein